MKAKPLKLEKEFFYELGIFAATLITVCFLYKNNILVTALLIAYWIFCLKFWHTKRDFFAFVSGAVLGPIAEIIAIRYGVWNYANPSFLNIPLWLPLAWGIFTMMIVRLTNVLTKHYGVKW